MKAKLFLILLIACYIVAFPFLKGASTCFCAGDGLDVLQYVGANSMRLKSIDPSLRVENLQQLYARNSSALDEFINSPELNWKPMDAVFNAFVGKIPNLIIEVGEGTVYGLPSYNGTYADPNVIGRDIYLAYQYRMTRAIVRRYNKFGVFMYQIENELNEAWLASIQGQRRFQFTGAWKDWSFLTRVLQVLNMAVKDEAPDAKTTMNFHTDVAQNFHRDLFLRGYYLDAVQDWQQYMDYISIDAYPNMYVSQPILANRIGERISAIKKLINNSKPVFVMETGYPMLNETTPAPSASLNFTQENGVQYITQVMESIKAANGDGLIYFKIAKGPGFSAPPGGFTDKDVEAMAMVSKLYEESSAWIFIKWILNLKNIDYLVTRMPTLLAGVESGWALLRMDGSFRQKPLDALKQAFQ